MSRLAYQHFIPIWRTAPFLRYLLPLMAGIVAGYYLPVSIFAAAIFLAIAIVFAGYCYRSKQRTRPLFGVGIACLFFAIGYMLVLLHNTKQWSSFMGKHIREGEMLIATMKEPLINKPNTYKTEASIQLLNDRHELMDLSGNIILYLQKDSSTAGLSYGSQIIFRNQLQPIKNAGNPGGFDYERYAAFNGLYYLAYLKQDDYEIAEGFYGNRLQKAIYDTRAWVINVFKTRIPGQKEAGLAEALLAGYKEDLDKDLIEQYASTGVIHIIAISGMHLGLLYVVLLLLFKPIRKRRYGLLISTISVIAVLWFFSFMTGAAPSITRAALMFTILLIGNNLKRKISPYNSLAIAAFILLLINPYNLWNVGFQLSFAALLSIVTFARAITALKSFSNIVLQKTWQLIAVTLSAQIFTLPFVIYHFHQFPLYFLLANLFAIPLSTIILYGLLILLVVSKIPLLGVWLGWGLSYLIKVMNFMVGWIGQLPGASFNNVQLDIVQAVLLMLFIACIAWWLMHQNSKALLAALSTCILFSSLIWWQYFNSLHQRRLIVYNIPRHTAIDIVQGRSFEFIGDDTLHQKGFLQNFHLLPSRIYFQAVQGTYELPSANEFTFINLNGQQLLILDKDLDFYKSDSIQTNLLLISKSKHLYPNQVLRKIKCDAIILDGTVNSFLQQQWKNAADSLHLRLHSTRDQGAFVLNF